MKAERKNKTVKALSGILTGTMILSAAAPIITAGAEGENTAASSKEEVIYINLGADGKVNDVYAVNIFGKGEVRDYGDYSSVELLNATDRIDYSDNCVTFSSDKNRVYYKGVMNSKEIPWNISLRYFIDGTEYSAEEAAGKSGRLEIKLSITENKECKGNYFDSYALQASLTLDTAKCTDIAATGATTANVGKDKQISYTILPGKELEASVTANVTDFEMESVSINGIPLNLDIDIDDSELTEEIDRLIDAVDEIDDGTGELADGTGELSNKVNGDLISGAEDLADGSNKLLDGMSALSDGSNALADGMKQLDSGAKELSSGAQSLGEGTVLIQNGLTELNSRSDSLTSGSAQVLAALTQIQTRLSAVCTSVDEISKLVDGSAQIKQAIASLDSGITELQSSISFTAYKAVMAQNGIDIDLLQSSNKTTIGSLSAQIKALQQNIAAMKQAGMDTAELEQTATQLAGIVQLLQGNSAAISGTDAYLSQLYAAAGQLSDGVKQLSRSYAELDAGINELADKVGSMLTSLAEMKSGIETLVAEYSKLDSGINEYTGAVAQIAAGYAEVVSGTRSLLSGSSTLADGTSQLADKTEELKTGVSEIYSATGTLSDGAKSFSDGANELGNACSELHSGALKLKDGTSELRSETNGMNGKISDKIDEMLDSITGGDEAVVSFTSDKNTDIASVQFVIKTEAIEIPEAPEEEPAAEEELNFWQKVLRLFGLY